MQWGRIARSDPEPRRMISLALFLSVRMKPFTFYIFPLNWIRVVQGNQYLFSECYCIFTWAVPYSFFFEKSFISQIKVLQRRSRIVDTAFSPSGSWHVSWTSVFSWTMVWKNIATTLWPKDGLCPKWNLVWFNCSEKAIWLGIDPSAGSDPNMLCVMGCRRPVFVGSSC